MRRPGPARHPATHCAYAKIERDVVSIGSLTRVEIWAKDRYRRHASPTGDVADFTHRARAVLVRGRACSGPTPRRRSNGSAIRPGGTYVDATFGAGGHTTGIALRLGRGRLVALDADPGAPSSRALSADSPGLQFELVHANFRDLRGVLDERGIAPVDGVLYDLGVSSMQLDERERGFSFREDAPLDMRLDPSPAAAPPSYSRDARRTRARRHRLTTSARSARRGASRARSSTRRRKASCRRRPASSRVCCRRGARARQARARSIPRRATFQALRIAVNDELGRLRESLDAAIRRRRRPGGRIVVDQLSLARRPHRQADVPRRSARHAVDAQTDHPGPERDHRTIPARAAPACAPPSELPHDSTARTPRRARPSPNARANRGAAVRTARDGGAISAR